MKKHIIWHRFLIEKSHFDTYTTIQLSEDEKRRFLRYCKSHFVYSGNNNVTEFLIDTGRLDLFKVIFLKDNLVRVRMFQKTFR